MHDEVTFLFTDIEGSTRLWEQEPERMRPALARHDAIVREAVQAHAGQVVKMTGDGIHAAFQDPLDAVRATLDLQQALADAAATAGLALPVRCGLHAGPNERRDGDFYGSVVNRAARIMSAAHGGQMLLSQAVAERIGGRLPDGVLLRDLGLVRLRDLSQAERLYQLVHPALRADFPALRSLEGTPNNLLHSVSSFVGRAREMEELAAAIRAHRLVTLLGVGGVGKSRLALQLAAESLPHHRDGVWLVELAPLHDASRVVGAIAQALGVKEEPGRPLEEALCRHVATRELLLVLDNCEHMLEACAGVARRLLGAGAGVRILATSREPLRIAGEATYVVPGLGVPGPLHSFSAEAVARHEAVVLFVERARAASPAFALDDENAAQVAAICHRLDGIPLAIELAAARARSMPVAQIAERLKHRFRLLTGGDPSALPRQRTLRALIDWSHELLPEEERVVFRRLAAFAGGCTLEAAEEVCGFGAIAPEAVLEVLGLLVEKSLLAVEGDSGRYRMLETVAEYARERLAESGEAAEAARRHLQHFVTFVEGGKRLRSGPGQSEWLARLDAENRNVLQALEWAARVEGSAGSALRLASGLMSYWINRGLLDQGERATLLALASPGASERVAERAGALFTAGQLRYFMGRYREARECLHECLGVARTLGAPYAAAVLQPLGMAAIGEGDLGTARSAFEESLQLAEQAGDAKRLAGAQHAMAMFHRVEGRPDLARALYERAMAAWRSLGDSESVAVVLVNLAMSTIDANAPDAAPAMIAQAAALAAEVGSAQARLGVLDVCAGLASIGGDWAAAARFYGAAEASAARMSAPRDPADRSFLLPKVERARAALGESFEAHAAAGGALTLEDAAEEASLWARARQHVEQPLTATP